jgi:hypothetical protein
MAIFVRKLRLEMSSNSNGNSTMSSVPAKTSKRVAKKGEAVAVAVVAPVDTVVSTPVVPVVTSTKTGRSKSSVAATVATTVATTEVVSTPVVAATSAPEAQAVVTQNEVVQVPVSEVIEGLVKRTQELRDVLAENMKELVRLQKRVARDLKEASKRRRKVRKEGVDGEQVAKRPTIFTTPLPLKDELATFLGKSKGTLMTPAEVTKAVRQYIDTHGLKDKENGHMIHPDVAMRRVLGVSDQEHLTYRNIQKYLYKLYVLPETKATKA